MRPVATTVCHAVRSVLLLASLSLFASAAEATVITFTATLEPEVLGSSGTGNVTAVFDTVAQELWIDADFAELTGTTTVAHIHCCVAPPGFANVAVTPGTLAGFPVGVQSGSVTTIVDLTAESSYTIAFRTNFTDGSIPDASAALLEGLNNGFAYFNIHTTFAPGGEIRGFLQREEDVAVPEPASLTLLGVGLAGMGVRRWRQRRQ